MRRIQLFAFLALAPFLFLARDGLADSWGPVLNPGGEAPLGAFKAIYINTENPRQIVATEIVPTIAINYAWSDFHGIKSENFAAYWVGRMDFRKEEARIIEVSQSWSKVRIFIDGQLAYEGGADGRKPYTFSKGRHLIEVEFANNWHTTSFRVAFNGAPVLLSASQVFEQLRSRKLPDAEVHYVGLYESSAKDLTVRLNIARSDRPLILVLNSYDSVNWVLSEALRGNVRAIVVGSLKPGSEVSGINPRKVPVLVHAGMIGPYDLKNRCNCVAARYHCESSGNLLTTVAAVENLTGAHMASYSGAYSAAAISLPGLAINAEAEEKSRISAEEELQKRDQCEKKANPDFDNMFGDKPPAPTKG